MFYPVVAFLAFSAAAQAESLRGDYTFGHEVNTFCPAKNTQCYWLGAKTGPAARNQLKQIYEGKKPGLYKPVCVVVEAVIDRDSPRDGFAADYDGLIHIESVSGTCADQALITPGDLNHRRWVLRARNGEPVDPEKPPVVLDFGERLFVEGRDGCQRFQGFSLLEGDELVLDGLDFDRSGCSPEGVAASLLAHWPRWRIAYVDRNLVLQNGDTSLAFERNDWR